MKYRITEYTNDLGNRFFRVEKKSLFGWKRIQRRLELADGWTDPFSRDEAMSLIEKDSGVRAAIINQEAITMCEEVKK
jgi:hypothetical protein